jgi:hypothetical protein
MIMMMMMMIGFKRLTGWVMGLYINIARDQKT